MGGCCRWGWLVRQGDTPDEARIKTSVFPFTLALFLVVVFLVFNELQSTNPTVYLIGHFIFVFCSLLFMVGVVSNAIPAGFLLDTILLLYTAGICAQDLGNATKSSRWRSWAFVVLVLDMALVFKRYHMPLFMIPFVLVYLAA
eukprot:Hpha_TRINITY_DN16272_c0_g1::TRINITY_DN16272_c0_g1_i6::g.12517::m.12517